MGVFQGEIMGPPTPYFRGLKLMMEQAYAREGHSDVVFVASHYHVVVAN